MKRLRYQQDRKVLRRFAKAPADTATTIIVRHTRAGSRSKYKVRIASDRWTSSVALRPNRW